MSHIIIVGGGGREAAFARKLAADSKVSALLTHRNPTIIECVENSGGTWQVDNINDGNIIADFAHRQKADLVFVNADNPLAAGVIDILQAKKIRTVGPTKQGAQIEWDKIFAMELMADLWPQYTPFFRVINAAADIIQAKEDFRAAQKDIVVKPQGLTGGKGVKVMGEHLRDIDEVAVYTQELLNAGNAVLWVEKLDGLEFTIMGLTDGKNTVCAPATYDYPYRYEGDTGPGTGGMGCFAAADGLPFLPPAQRDECADIIAAVVARFREQKRHFNGVLNGGFFLTAEGIKFMEFNARFGDPEALNVLAVLRSSFAEVLQHMAAQTLATVAFAPRCSVVKYLVSPSYPHQGEALNFCLAEEELSARGLSVFYAAAERADNGGCRTVSSSRVAAITCTDTDIPTAAKRINNGLAACSDGVLEYRADIGTAAELARLNKQAKDW